MHAYVFASPGCKKWDTCAPEALLKAKGGTLTDMHGMWFLLANETETLDLCQLHGQGYKGL